jgi:hypothetical protein
VWYDNIRRELGERFALAVEATVEAVAEHPVQLAVVYRNRRRTGVWAFRIAYSSGSGTADCGDCLLPRSAQSETLAIAVARATHDHRNRRRILGGQNPKATPTHRLQKRRGSAAAPARNCRTPVILSEAAAQSKDPYHCKVCSADGMPPATLNCSARFPGIALVDCDGRDPSTALSLAARPPTPLRMTNPESGVIHTKYHEAGDILTPTL